MTAPVRCYTRALKNARYLQEQDPETFTNGPDAAGFGTGVPTQLLRTLHRMNPDSPAIHDSKIAESFRRSRPATPSNGVSDPLFSGTIHFAQLTFKTSRRNKLVASADMEQIVAYAQQAIVPIREYTAQYGTTTATISPQVISKTVEALTGRYTDAILQGWVNQLATENQLGPEACIFVINPSGISLHDVGANSGYHSKANIPYIAAGVFGTGLTLADEADAYAMVISHEIAEMIVDPNVDNANPEVCDPCDLNCKNLTRCYFDAAGRYLGSNTSSPPGGYPFTFYTCAIAKPAGCTNCPAPATDCSYSPTSQ